MLLPTGHTINLESRDTEFGAYDAQMEFNKNNILVSKWAWSISRDVLLNLLTIKFRYPSVTFEPVKLDTSFFLC